MYALGVKDLLITFLYLILIYIVAYIIRPKFSDIKTRRYFIPGLTLKIIGAIAVGLIYHYYYGKGDTLHYYYHGSKYIFEAFIDSPYKAFKLIFANGVHFKDTIEYSAHIWHYRDMPSYAVVRIAGFFDLFTFHTYTATAVFFAVASFSGLWAMYNAFYKFYPALHKELAIAIFFIPSVYFWGSGILKDTLTLGALGWATYGFIYAYFFKKNIIFSWTIFLISCYLIYSVKIYILLCFFPALIIWIFLPKFQQMKSLISKIIIAPIFLAIAFGLAYFSISKIGEDNSKYSLDNLSLTMGSTAMWINHVSEREGGSSYTLGDFDYSPQGMFRKTLPAIWVSLFRPYLWEVKNPVMLLAALESLGFLLFTIYVLYFTGIKKIYIYITSQPIILFCLIFSLTFALAIGMSTYNFGSLVRYKIPIMPFFLIALFLIQYNKKIEMQKIRINRERYLKSFTNSTIKKVEVE